MYFGKKYGFDPTAVEHSETASDRGRPRRRRRGCGDSTPPDQLPKCASKLTPWDAALLAGMVASPTAFDPIAASAGRQATGATWCSRTCSSSTTSPREQYDQGINAPLPTANDIQQPSEPTAAPYFTSWLRPADRRWRCEARACLAGLAEYRAYYGGLKIRTTLDLDMQKAAEQAISSELPTG